MNNEKKKELTKNLSNDEINNIYGLFDELTNTHTSDRLKLLLELLNDELGSE
jgi:hypothetical protein